MQRSQRLDGARSFAEPTASDFVPIIGSFPLFRSQQRLRHTDSTTPCRALRRVRTQILSTAVDTPIAAVDGSGRAPKKGEASDERRGTPTAASAADFVPRRISLWISFLTAVKRQLGP